ncbi:hypothetical protein HS7_00500 [Sulfolobales archaeon HS-7]|nr:hypothetical protein HS7_00500 [Sulfolobales archaeon HS-7]
MTRSGESSYVYKKGGNRGGDSPKKREDSEDEGENWGSGDRFSKDLSFAGESRGEIEYEEECLDLLRELMLAASEEASLHLRLVNLLNEARNETIRLSGMIAMLAFFEDKREIAKLRREIEPFFQKYVDA